MSLALLLAVLPGGCMGRAPECIEGAATCTGDTAGAERYLQDRGGELWATWHVCDPVVAFCTPEGGISVQAIDGHYDEVTCGPSGPSCANGGAPRCVEMPCDGVEREL